ncbi:SRPBCC family protein [Pontibacter sp. SGAir0037]|uniref:SRPBCC family protein n=1 Tax=Pontibacter sp. SGAir0037 TaxID=2571030 RepID=UPI0010CCBD75|nr:SRPBCC family protein [Pontibacter sp. SGAir0037]QCR21297.1 hypothetical protein C1N53_02320 [Pontibacter sp. SGAir0037]
MKLLLKLFLLLLLLAAALSAYAYYFLPRQTEVRQAIFIEATPEQVYRYIHNPTQWELWTPWNKANDPSLIHMYGGPWSGAGATHRWSGDKFGNSFILFVESNSPVSLRYEQTIEGTPYKTSGAFQLEKAGDSTQVVWLQTTPLANNPLALVQGAWRKKRIEEEMAAGLNGLKALVVKNSTKRASR